jgi:ankyrin repeat protein
MNNILDISPNLINKHKEYNNGDSYTINPIMKAAESGYIDIVEKLLKKGANINDKNNLGWDAFTVACRNKDTIIAKLLLEFGEENGAENRADINTTDSEGIPILSWACAQGQTNRDINLVNFLLENGADMYKQDNEGYHPFVRACRYEKIVELFLNKNPDIINSQSKNKSTCLIRASQEKKIEVIKLLVERGADINQKGFADYTAIYWSCGENGNIDIVKYLLEKGADVNVQGYNGYNPLHHASYFGQKDIVKLLLEQPGIKVDIETTDESKYTAIKLATIKREQIRQETGEETGGEIYNEIINLLEDYWKAKGNKDKLMKEIPNIRQEIASLATTAFHRLSSDEIQSVFYNPNIDIGGIPGSRKGGKRKTRKKIKRKTRKIVLKHKK